MKQIDLFKCCFKSRDPISIGNKNSKPGFKYRNKSYLAITERLQQADKQRIQKAKIDAEDFIKSVKARKKGLNKNDT